jgi:hypothetical protein
MVELRKASWQIANPRNRARDGALSYSKGEGVAGDLGFAKERESAPRRSQPFWMPGHPGLWVILSEVTRMPPAHKPALLLSRSEC